MMNFSTVNASIFLSDLDSEVLRKNLILLDDVFQYASGGALNELVFSARGRNIPDSDDEFSFGNDLFLKKGSELGPVQLKCKNIRVRFNTDNLLKLEIVFHSPNMIEDWDDKENSKWRRGLVELLSQHLRKQEISIIDDGDLLSGYWWGLYLYCKS